MTTALYWLSFERDSTDVQVYVLWKEYQDKCGDQSALLFEFVQWYRSELDGDIEALIAATEEK